MTDADDTSAEGVVEAPSALRSAISRRREERRARSELAMFTHPMSNTSDAPATRR